MSGQTSQQTNGAVRIVVADDHEVVRAGLRLLLDAEPGFDVVVETGDVDGAVLCSLEHRPQVVLLDLNMPGTITAFEAILKIREASPRTQVVVLTMEADPAFARAALQAGALGYVLKEAAEVELIEAVRRASAGDQYLNPRLRAALASLPVHLPGDDLSQRQTAVLRLIGLGYMNREIGEELSISVRTVESHRAHIQRKLGCSTRADFVRYALDRGLLS